MPFFVDDAQTGGGNSQLDPAIFALNPKSAMMQIRQKFAPRFVVRVRNIVAGYGFFAGYLTDSCHDFARVCGRVW